MPIVSLAHGISLECTLEYYENSDTNARTLNTGTLQSFGSLFQSSIKTSTTVDTNDESLNLRLLRFTKTDDCLNVNDEVISIDGEPILHISQWIEIAGSRIVKVGWISSSSVW